MSTNLLLLDLDGTVRRCKSDPAGFINAPLDQEIIPEADAALERWSAAGALIVACSNQAGVAAGYKTIGECIDEQIETMRLAPHKASNSPPRGVRHIESYRNTWTQTATNKFASWYTHELRGGTGMIWGNSNQDNSYGGRGLIRLIDYSITSNAWGNFDYTFQTPFNYPIDDQIGVGMDPKAGGSEPMYLWGNTKAGRPTGYNVTGSGDQTLYNTQLGNATAITALGTVGTAFKYLFGGSNAPTSYTAAGLPPGLSFTTSATEQYAVGILVGRITGTPTTAGTYTVNLSASTASDTSTATLTIIVSATASTLPAITSVLSTYAFIGGAFSYQLTATNSPTSFSADNLPDGLDLDETTGIISGTFTDASGFYAVPVTATNASGTTPGVFTIRCVPSGVKGAVTLSGVSFSVSDIIQADRDYYSGDALASAFDGSSGVGSGTKAQMNAITPSKTGVGFWVTDEASWDTTLPANTSGQLYTWNGSAWALKYTPFTYPHPLRGDTSSLPAKPVITSATSASGVVGTPFSYTITGTHSPTSFTAVGLPAGLSYDPLTGVISGTPTAATTSATPTVPINATNAGGTGTAQLALSITANASATPVITSAGSASATVGTAFSYTVTATNSPTSYGASGLPAGLSINAGTGLISGTPTSAGNFSATLSATNSGGGTGTSTLNLTIAASGSAPSITSATTGSGQVGTAFSYTITATNSPNSFAATGLPGGLFINTATGVISGTPTAAGTTSINLRATNSMGTGTQIFTLTVAAAPPPAPVINSATTASGTAGVAFSYQITATNSPTSFAASGPVDGLSLNTTTGLISGTPTSAGTFSLSLSATNAGGTGTATLTFTVAAPPPPAPAFTSPASASAVVGQAFSFQITASNSPTSFAATGLPAGLTINTSTGVISGTPTSAGTFTVTFSASN